MNGEVADLFATRLMLSTRLMSELADVGTRLRAVVQRSDTAVIIHAGGEVDACNEGSWRRLVREAAKAARPPGPLIVDVNGFDFIGSCAFEVLADAARRCGRRGIALYLVSPGARVARFVEACGFGDVLTVYPTAGAALAATP
jgi:anti-anti-sigma factor